MRFAVVDRIVDGSPPTGIARNKAKTKTQQVNCVDAHLTSAYCYPSFDYQMKLMTETYTYRAVSETDLPALSQLYASSFDKTVSVDTLKAKFSTNDFGTSFAGYVAAAEDDSLAAFYGLFPVRMQIGGEIVLGAQSGDTMTHPNHRKRGLFVNLAEMTYELARTRGIKLVFGFPNEQSMPGFKKNLSWTFLPRMVTARFMSKSLCKSFSRFFGNNILDELRTLADDNVEIHENFNSVLKDRLYLRYKAKISGSMQIRSGNLICWLKPGKRIDVGTFETTTPLTKQQLRTEFQELLAMTGAGSLRFCFSKDHPRLQEIASFCDCHPSTVAGYRLLDSSLKFEDLHFCLGDFDYF